ncbi:MAG: alpha/beta hydrolase [Pseudomonadota bacterium]|jgi:pimeloyl-ACP methyl ester carboxylesterase|nr:alpha/beta hydrolase [Alphaproteobacteria bacterium]
MQSYYLPSTAAPSLNIAVRLNTLAQPKAVVLLLHGATLPSIIFDLPSAQGQLSMMAYLKMQGYATYSLDYRGYGDSSKPLEMDASAGSSPLITHKDAMQDVLDVMSFIKERHPTLPIILCGFSWGSSISGYITTHFNWVNKLILLGPVYSYPNPQWQELADPKNPTKLNPGIKGYRLAARERWCGLWERELKMHDTFNWRDPQTLEQLLDYMENTDIAWANRTNNKGYIRIPTGVLADALRTYNQNPIYDASKIQCPTLVLRGENDTASLSADVDGLMNTLICSKRRIDIENATHYGILEKGAERFFKVMVNFIETA